MSEVKIRMRIKRGDLATWTAVNPTLEMGEMGYFVDEQKFIIGDGTTPAMTLWNNLVRWAPESEGGGGGGLLAATEWDANHTTATGNPYAIGTLVWYGGKVYECIATNDGIIPTNASYWDDLGVGFKLDQVLADWASTSGASQILNKPSLDFVEGVTENGAGGISVDNTDPANPILSFTGVTTDGVTIFGNGLDQPLALNGTADNFTVMASAYDLYPGYLDAKLLPKNSTITIDPYTSSSAIYLSVLYSYRILVEGQNKNLGPVTVGTPMYFDSMTGFYHGAKSADASQSAKMPAVGLAYQDAAGGGGCSIITHGFLENVVTDPIDGVTPITGQTLYVKPGGGLTTTKPTGTNLVQVVGKVGIVSSTNTGTILVNCLQSSADLPNLPDANVWVGNASGVPAATQLSGDVTMNNAAQVTIKNQAVTFSKIQHIQTKHLLGRLSPGNGDVEEIDYSIDGTLGGASASNSIVSSQAAVKTYVDTVAATKEPTLTKGNLTETTSSVLTITGGSSAVIGSGTTLQVKQSGASQAGYLSSTDWSTFNNKQAALVSGTNIKTVNSTSLLGSGDVAVQPTLVSGTNIKTVNSTSLLGSGDVAVQATLVSGTNIKTVNSTSLLGSGDLAVQDKLVSGTNIKTVDGSSILGSGNLLANNMLQIMAALGSTVKAATIGFDYGQFFALNTGGALLSGRLQLVPFYLSQAATLTGVKIMCSTAGNYTGNNYNGVGLYTYSGGTLTLVASTTNDANFWKPTANTLTAKPFSATYSASAGMYYLGFLYSSSAQTTAPALPVINIFASPYGTMDFTNSAKIYGSINSQTALPSSQAMSGVAVFTSGYLMFVY